MLTQLIIHFSYPGVFLILLATGFGVPIPEELPIAIAAMMARWEVMHWWGALLSCLSGVLAGDMLLYGLGRHFGRASFGVILILRSHRMNSFRPTVC